MRGLRRILVVLVVLGGLLLVADRVGAWVAQRTVADQVASELAANQIDSAPPEVSIGGFPFLTQVAAGQYDEVTVLLRDVGSAGVRVSQVELTATGVSAAASTLVAQEGPIDAAQVQGTATIGYGGVVALTGLDGLSLGPAPDGALAVRLPTELLGEPVTLVGTADLAVDAGAVRLRVNELTVEDTSGLPPGAEPLVEEIVAQLTLDVALPPMPYGLTVDSVRAESGGLAVSVSATDVPLAR